MGDGRVARCAGRACARAGATSRRCVSSIGFSDDGDIDGDGDGVRGWRGARAGGNPCDGDGVCVCSSSRGGARDGWLGVGASRARGARARGGRAFYPSASRGRGRVERERESVY